MSNKKLPAALQKLLDSHSQAWQLNQQELDKRINNTLIRYERNYPTINDDLSNSQVVIYKTTFYELLQEIMKPCWREYEIDFNRSSGINGAYKVFMNKPDQLKNQDIKRIRNEVEQKYLAELEAVKQEYIENLLHEYEEQQAEAKAQKEQEQQAKLKEQLLSMLN